MGTRVKTSRLPELSNKDLDKLDVVAASTVDEWTSIVKKENGQHWGKPSHGMSERPVIRYSRDISRAMHLVRKACRNAYVGVSIDIEPEDIVVVASTLDAEERELFYASCLRTDMIAAVLTKCAIAIMVRSTSAK